MGALGISRELLASWSADCGLMLVPKPEQPFHEITVAALKDDRFRFDGETKVYFVRESGTGAIKIGTSKQLSKRLAELARVLPYAIDLLATIDGGREVEWTIHNRFDHARIRGEWFRPVSELLEYIAEINTPRNSGMP